MSGKTDLQRALTALNDAMTGACSPRPLGTRSRWTGDALRAASIGRRVEIWDALPAEPAGAAAVVATLRDAAGAIEDMDCADRDTVDAALALVEAALRDLEHLFG